jgi:3-oxoacyl-[acyl-carrier protein] reductase
MKDLIKDVVQSFKQHSSTSCQTTEASQYNMASLKGMVAIVTGGSKGIGKATTLALANAGATVVINYASDAGAAEAVVKEVGSEHAYAVQADVSKMSGIEYLVKSTVDKYKKIDILIPNAGIMTLKTLEQATEEDFDKIFSTNVKGPLFLVQVSSFASSRRSGLSS